MNFNWIFIAVKKNLFLMLVEAVFNLDQVFEHNFLTSVF